MSDVFELLDDIRGIARTGLHYATDPFDRERYTRLMDLAVRGFADRTSLDEDAVRARFDAEVGLQTARIGADAAVFDHEDRLLLVRRADDGKWGLVAGWVEPNEAPEHTVVRELAEEVGLDARVERLVGVFTRPARTGEHPHGTVSVLYLCAVTGGTLRPQAHEVLEIAWRNVDDLAPDDWHHHHETLARAAREEWWRARIGV